MLCAERYCGFRDFLSLHFPSVRSPGFSIPRRGWNRCVRLHSCIFSLGIIAVCPNCSRGPSTKYLPTEFLLLSQKSIGKRRIRAAVTKADVVERLTLQP